MDKLFGLIIVNLMAYPLMVALAVVDAYDHLQSHSRARRLPWVPVTVEAVGTILIAILMQPFQFVFQKRVDNENGNQMTAFTVAGMILMVFAIFVIHNI